MPPTVVRPWSQRGSMPSRRREQRAGSGYCHDTIVDDRDGVERRRAANGAPRLGVGGAGGVDEQVDGLAAPAPDRRAAATPGRRRRSPVFADRPRDAPLVAVASSGPAATVGEAAAADATAARPSLRPGCLRAWARWVGPAPHSRDRSTGTGTSRRSRHRRRRRSPARARSPRRRFAALLRSGRARHVGLPRLGIVDRLGRQVLVAQSQP